MNNRIKATFDKCANENRAALVTYIMAGDPNIETSQKIINGLPSAGADIIELGMAFSDPMADGPVIEAAAHRALNSGLTIEKTLNMVEEFRQNDKITPIVLMGYYNPIYILGVEKFLKRAKQVGIDGLIIVDLPSEEDEELCLPALKKEISFIRLTTPTTKKERLKKVLKNSSGFIYYVSMTGITGANIVDYDKVGLAVENIKSHTDLPVAVGFGIKTATDAQKIGQYADGVVVGTALVKAIENSLENNKATKNSVNAILNIVRSLASGVKKARN